MDDMARDVISIPGMGEIVVVTCMVVRKPEMALVTRIAGILDRPRWSDDDASVDGRLWDLSSMCRIDMKQR